MGMAATDSTSWNVIKIINARYIEGDMVSSLNKGQAALIAGYFW